MKTTHFQMNLMVPNQLNKDLVFNESLMTIDNFLNNTVDGTFADTPLTLEVGKKYIITNGEHRNKICFRLHEARAIEFLQPQNGSLFFSLETRHFMLYHNDHWEQLRQTPAVAANDTAPAPGPAAQVGNAARPEAASRAATNNLRFTNTNGEFRATENKPFYYLYVNDHSALLFDQLTEPEITIVLKQARNATHQIVWQYSVLWEEGVPHFLSETPNSMDIVKLFKLPESNHFIGRTIARDIRF
jgi:hypothetical protein